MIHVVGNYCVFLLIKKSCFGLLRGKKHDNQKKMSNNRKEVWLLFDTHNLPKSRLVSGTMGSSYWRLTDSLWNHTLFLSLPSPPKICYFVAWITDNRNTINILFFYSVSVFREYTVLGLVESSVSISINSMWGKALREFTAINNVWQVHVWTHTQTHT